MHKSKLLLINPHWTTIKGYEDAIRVSFPNGLASIAAYCLPHAEIQVIDMLAEGYDFTQTTDNIIRVGMSLSELQFRVISFNPDFVAISSMFTSQSLNAYEVAEAIREVSHAKIIIGGAHPSVTDITDPNIDFVVKGEGEESVRHIISGETKDRVVTSPLIDISNIPSIPFHLFPMQKYFDAQHRGIGARSSSFGRSMSVVTSRGCPYTCNFCSVHTVMGRKFRTKSPESVIHEIQILVKDYGVKHIFFEDDNLTFSKHHAEEIFTLLGEHTITWSTPNGIRADRLTPAIVKLMKQSGCKQLTIAIESGSQSFLTNVIKKNLDLSHIDTIVDFIRAEGIDLTAFFIIGFPNETESDIQQTISLAIHLAKKGVRPYFNIATPLPGTDLYNDAIANNWLTKIPTPTDYLTSMQIPLLKSPHNILEIRRQAIKSCAISLLTHSPLSFLCSESFNRLRHPFTMLKILNRGTC